MTATPATFALRPHRRAAFLRAAEAAGYDLGTVADIGELCAGVVTFARTRADLAEGLGAVAEVLYHARRGERIALNGGMT